MAAATTELWPSIANTVMIPWRASTTTPSITRNRHLKPATQQTVEKKVEVLEKVSRMVTPFPRFCANV